MSELSFQTSREKAVQPQSAVQETSPVRGVGRREFLIAAACVATGVFKAREARAGRFRFGLGNRIASGVSAGMGQAMGDVINGIVMLVTVGLLVAIPIMIVTELIELIKKELKLGAEQVAKLAALRDRVMAELKTLADLPPAERQSRMTATLLKLDPEYRRHIEGLLTPDQRVRFRQIMLQLRGAASLNETEIAWSLGLSIEQHADVMALLARHSGESAAAMKPEAGNLLQRWAKLRRLRADLEGRVAEVLTPEQQHQFAELKGPAVAGLMAALI